MAYCKSGLFIYLFLLSDERVIELLRWLKVTMLLLIVMVFASFVVRYLIATFVIHVLG